MFLAGSLVKASPCDYLTSKRRIYIETGVEIIDSAGVVAKHVEKLLKEKNMLNASGKATHHFYVSDYTDSFEKSTRLFFKGKIHLEDYPLWKNE